MNNKSSDFQYTLVLELLILAFTIVLAFLVLLPLTNSKVDYPFFIENIVFIFTFILVTRYVFLLKYSLLAKQQAVKDRWNSLPNRENFTAWVFDETSCLYIPPIPMPDDDKLYRWDGTVNNWVEVTPPAII